MSVLLIVVLLAACLATLKLGGMAAGVAERPSATWHPACWLAEYATLGTIHARTVVAFLFLLASLAGVLWMDGIARSLAAASIVFLIVPLPWFVLDIARRDASVKLKEFVYFDCYSPVGTRYIRQVAGGKLEEEAPMICLFMDDSDWQAISVATPSDRRYMSKYAVPGAPGFYQVRGDNEFMQFFDSLQLYRYVIHPGNAKAMDAFVAALRASAACNHVSSPALASQLENAPRQQEEPASAGALPTPHPPQPAVAPPQSPVPSIPAEDLSPPKSHIPYKHNTQSHLDAPPDMVYDDAIDLDDSLPSGDLSDLPPEMRDETAALTSALATSDKETALLQQDEQDRPNVVDLSTVTGHGDTFVPDKKKKKKRIVADDNDEAPPRTQILPPCPP